MSDVICIKRENIILLNLFLFKEEACISYADNVDPEQKLRSVVSDLALHALPMSLFMGRHGNCVNAWFHGTYNIETT